MTMQLIPAYRTKIESEPVVQKSVKIWSTECVEQLKGCFECTDWNVGLFVDSCEHINDTPDVITDYIPFCEDMIIPKKIVKVFPNNKPWIANSLKKVYK